MNILAPDSWNNSRRPVHSDVSVVETILRVHFSTNLGGTLYKGVLLFFTIFNVGSNSSTFSFRLQRFLFESTNKTDFQAALISCSNRENWLKNPVETDNLTKINITYRYVASLVMLLVFNSFILFFSREKSNPYNSFNSLFIAWHMAEVLVILWNEKPIETLYYVPTINLRPHKL